jgi:hypothetical protein
MWRNACKVGFRAASLGRGPAIRTHHTYRERLQIQQQQQQQQRLLAVLFSLCRARKHMQEICRSIIIVLHTNFPVFRSSAGLDMKLLEQE